MSLSVRPLPVIQNWDCHGCGECCHEYRIHITDEEKARIEAQKWEEEPEFKGVKLFVTEGWLNKKVRLNHKPDGACVFLNEKGLCKIHGKFGEPAKPLACRVYPFALVPAGDHWRVGLRFACPSTALSKGRSVDAHLPAVRGYASMIESRELLSTDNLPPPPCARGQEVSWPDMFRFVKAMRALVETPGVPLELRLRRCLTLAAVCRDARFDRVSGDRLGDFLELMSSAAVDETVPRGLAEPPSWVGRSLFRRTLAVYVRKDAGANRGISRKGRLALMWAAYRFASGRGTVPRLHALIPKVTFAQVEANRIDLPESVDAMLTRYYAVKLESMQFCGRTNYDLNVWDGLDTLMFTFPAICWMAAALHDVSRDEAFVRALRTVDDNFGYNPLLGGRMQKWGMRLLSGQRELAKLVAWYGGKP